MTRTEFGTISSVWPSGLARATYAAPIAPVAPGRLSTITGVRRLSDMIGATAREIESATPPAWNGQTRVIGRVGNLSCAPATAEAAHRTKTILLITATS